MKHTYAILAPESVVTEMRVSMTVKEWKLVADALTRDHRAAGWNHTTEAFLNAIRDVTQQANRVFEAASKEEA